MHGVKCAGSGVKWAGSGAKGADSGDNGICTANLVGVLKGAGSGVERCRERAQMCGQRGQRYGQQGQKWPAKEARDAPVAKKTKPSESFANQKKLKAVSVAPSIPCI